jgi:DNA-binding response OmpR family regulator
VLPLWDDYLGKPFFVEELAARINVILRRKTPQTTDVRS